jgi:hypothetical protein
MARAAVAYCKVYEIPGRDARRTDAAVRCLRTATSHAIMDSYKVPICDVHQAEGWELFMHGGWAYAIDPNAEAFPHLVKDREHQERE